MSQISRSEFVGALASANVALDVRGLTAAGHSGPTATGVDVEGLRRAAGPDGIVATPEEYGRLFDVIDRLDRDVSRRSMGAAPWLDIARGELGQKEVTGAGDNPRILEYHRSVRGGIASDEVPWCSSFANWVMQQAGVPGTGSARALSWLNWGQPLASPAVGSLAVIDWGQGKGHVGFVVGRSGDRIVVAGGNQNDRVGYATYRLDQIASFRVPDGYHPQARDFQLPAIDVRHANQSLETTR